MLSPTTLNSFVVFPLSNSILYFLLFLLISTKNCFERALTTEAPTPWRPPDTLYPPPPNFPPAWRTVWITSTAGLFNLRCKSTGIPRPSSITVISLSFPIITFIFLQYPARASSILLSTIS